MTGVGTGGQTFRMILGTWTEEKLEKNAGWTRTAETAKPVTYCLNMQVQNVEIKIITNSTLRTQSSAKWEGGGGYLRWRKRGEVFKSCVFTDTDQTRLRFLPVMFSGGVLIMRTTWGPSPFAVTAARLMLYLDPGVKFTKRCSVTEADTL